MNNYRSYRKRAGTSIIVPGLKKDAPQNEMPQTSQSDGESTSRTNVPAGQGKSSLESLLFSENGIETLKNYANNLKLSGKPGDEKKDLHSLLCIFSEFFHARAPKKSNKEILDYLLKHSDQGLQRLSEISHQN